MTAAALRPNLRTGTCRFCGTALTHSFADLGVMPPSNAYVRPADLSEPETFYPLHAFVCGACYLVQLEEFATPEQLFTDYAYFSSYSESWLHHAEAYAAMACDQLGIGPGKRVVEIASNDGYLLQYFASRGIEVLGIEPAANVARVARDKGIPTQVRFFGRATARKLVEDGLQADLLIGNNVLAHVPNLNDFVAALKIALAPDGIITMEFPHLLRLIRETQFDTIYHEHFSYLSLMTVERIFAAHGLTLFDCQELPTHGGSLRIFAAHAEAGRAPEPAIEQLRESERLAGLDRLETYDGFADQVRRTKRRLLAFLTAAKEDGKSIVGYGAAAKGNTLLNWCGVGPDFLDYVVDANPNKQGLYLPGSRIPIHAPGRIRETRPDYVLILPWNLEQEIRDQASYIAEWGGKFVIPIPEVRVVP